MKKWLKTKRGNIFVENEFIRILCVYNIWYIVNVMYNVKIENELLFFALLYKMNKINFI
jgi:hypothetical protein